MFQVVLRQKERVQRQDSLVGGLCLSKSCACCRTRARRMTLLTAPWFTPMSDLSTSSSARTKLTYPNKQPHNKPTNKHPYQTRSSQKGKPSSKFHRLNLTPHNFPNTTSSPSTPSPRSNFTTSRHNLPKNSRVCSKKTQAEPPPLICELCLPGMIHLSQSSGSFSVLQTTGCFCRSRQTGTPFSLEPANPGPYLFSIILCFCR